MSSGSSSAWASSVIIGAITAIALTGEWLPARVASHFGSDGFANAFVARTTYLVLMVGMTLALPLFLGIVVGTSLRHFPQTLNIPNRDYWLAPSRRVTTNAYVLAHTTRLAAWLALSMTALHLVVIHANRVDPPHLEAGALVALLVAFLLGVGVWIGALTKRFRRPAGA